MTRCVVIIPARLHSSRLPRKMLLAQTGKPLVVHTLESALRARKPQQVIVATDSEEIAQAVRSHGGQAVLTSADCPSGTDRVAQVAQKLPQFDLVVNLQGDEPEMNPRYIDQVVELLERNPQAPMSTLAVPIRDPQLLHDPACVKVVFNAGGEALYFSRAPIPFDRDGTWVPQQQRPLGWQHLGLYAYRRQFLLHLAQLPPSPLEQVEKLEQLRVLEAGHRIQVGTAEAAPVGIDTWEDYQAFVRRQRRRAA